jgi:hypothetical protein
MGISLLNETTNRNMTWTKVLHQDIIPTIRKAGALKIRILAVRKARENGRKDKSFTTWRDKINDTTDHQRSNIQRNQCIENNDDEHQNPQEFGF